MPRPPQDNVNNMVFPSRGCITCKKRHIKCDSVRPVCSRCQKASRDCAWAENEESGLLFKNENDFAQGKRRRPWQPKEQKAIVSVPEISLSSPALVPAPAPAPAPLTPPLVSVENEAFHFWFRNFVSQAEEMPEFAPVSAYSHAVFGRVMRLGKATEEADKLFTRSIARVRAEIPKLTQHSIDELLVTTMLLAFYENVMFRDRTRQDPGQGPVPLSPEVTGSQFWKNVSHHDGAAGLLKLRQQRGWAPNLSLHRAIRRQLIRTCILRGVSVAEWLRNGVQFGEESPTLELDSIFVRVAALREKSLCLFLPESVKSSSQPRHDDLAAEAQALDFALESWSATIPEGWGFSLRRDSVPDVTFDGLAHVYTTHGHAAVWNRYRAVRLIVNSIRKRALSITSRSSSQTMLASVELEACIQKMASLATDLCRGIPCFFTSDATAGGITSTGTTRACDRTVRVEYGILPRLATFLAWPLTLAVSTDDVPDLQKQWLKCKLRYIANALGDTVLELVIEQGNFKF